MHTIAARYAAALTAAETITPSQSDEGRLNILRSVMRFGLVWNRLASEWRYSSKEREDFTDEEWRAYISDSVSFYNSNLRDFGSEENCVAYITHWMSWLFPELKRANPSAALWADKLDASEIPEIIKWFVSLPDAQDYGYRQI